MLFVFLVTLWSGDYTSDIHVVDVDLTGADCILRMVKYYEQDPNFEYGVPSCEIQQPGVVYPD